MKVFATILAFACLALCQGAEIQRSQTNLEPGIILQNSEAIAKTVFKSLNSLMTEAKPNLDKILNELAPEAKELLENLLKHAQVQIQDHEKRIDVIFKTLHKALKDLAPIKPCFDKFSGEGKKLALQSEKALVKIVTDIMRKYEKDISKLRNGLRKVLTEARELFDKQVPAIVKCLKPGRKDSNACVKKELNTTFGGVLKVVTDLTTVIEIANNNLEPAKNEFFTQASLLLIQTVESALKIIGKLSSCVADMKSFF